MHALAVYVNMVAPASHPSDRVWEGDMGHGTRTASPRYFPVAISAFLLLILSSRGSEAEDQRADFAKNTVLVWSTATLQAIHDVQPGPPIAARALAIVHTCMFDAWASFDERAVATRPSRFAKRAVAERTFGNKSEAISFAAYLCLADQFPSRKPYFTAVMQRLGYNPANASQDSEGPAGIGIVAAREVLQFRHHDGSNQLGDLHPGSFSDYTDYHSDNQPDQLRDIDSWQPLAVPNGAGRLVNQTFIAPHWGKVIPFALKSGDQFRPPAPPASLPMSALLENREYQEQAREVLQYTASLTDEQKVMAEYWADGPRSTYPPGHWCAFAEFVSIRDKHSIDEDIKLFFVLANSIMDAGIAAWDAKRAYDSVRPISAIRFLFHDKIIRGWAGPGLDNVEIPGQDWIPYQDVAAPTPPFPEFFSGHSAFSAAAAEVLKRFTGSDVFGMQVTFASGSSRIEPGMTPKANVSLSWATFSDAADQAGMSRRFGGIHFKNGDLVGREVGRRIGAEAWRKAQQYLGSETARGADQSDERQQTAR